MHLTKPVFETEYVSYRGEMLHVHRQQEPYWICADNNCKRHLFLLEKAVEGCNSICRWCAKLHIIKGFEPTKPTTENNVLSYLIWNPRLQNFQRVPMDTPINVETPLVKPKPKPKRKIKINVSKLAWDKMFYYAHGVDSEIGGLIIGRTKKKGRTDIWNVEDILLTEQEVGSSSLEMDSKKLADWFSKTVEQDISMAEKVLGGFHSHYTFSCFWSATDTETSENWAKLSGKCLSIVVNQAGNYNIRVNIKDKDDVWTYETGELKINIPVEKKSKLQIECEKEIKKKVRKETIKPVTCGEYYSNYFDGFYSPSESKTVSPFISDLARLQHIVDRLTPEAKERYELIRKPSKKIRFLKKQEEYNKLLPEPERKIENLKEDWENKYYWRCE